MNPNLPKVALIGRPNVGKSSLFNALMGYERSIVLDLPGTTLDIVSEKVNWKGSLFRLMDTQGALDESDIKTISEFVGEADLCLFVVDARVGPSPFDRELAKHILQLKLPCLLCVNKSDGKKAEVPEVFAELGLEDVVAVSATEKKNINDIRAWVSDQVKILTPDGQAERTESEDPTVTMALIGKPNTGKSTLMNRLCGDKVSRVSPLPLTTRDTISYEIIKGDSRIRILDTAGIRRPRSAKGDIEKFSIKSSQKAMREADVIVLLVDAHEPISDQDMRLLTLAKSEGKPTLVLLNFWDLLTGKQQKSFWDDIDFTYYIKQFETLAISAANGLNTEKIISIVSRMGRKAGARVPTSKLNKIVEKIVTKNPPPSTGRQNFNILYASQVQVAPPTFVFFMNRKQALPLSYKKYLTNELSHHLRLKGHAVRILFREKGANPFAPSARD